jgi:hypothetical protein
MNISADDFEYPVTDKNEILRHPAVLLSGNDFPASKVIKIHRLVGGDLVIEYKGANLRELSKKRVERIKRSAISNKVYT